MRVQWALQVADVGVHMSDGPGVGLAKGRSRCWRWH